MKHKVCKKGSTQHSCFISFQFVTVSRAILCGRSQAFMVTCFTERLCFEDDLAEGKIFIAQIPGYIKRVKYLGSSLVNLVQQ